MHSLDNADNIFRLRAELLSVSKVPSNLMIKLCSPHSSINSKENDE